jgi:hypothetical protein
MRESGRIQRLLEAFRDDLMSFLFIEIGIPNKLSAGISINVVITLIVGDFTYPRTIDHIRLSFIGMSFLGVIFLRRLPAIAIGT